jgi:hypothetical protein
MFEPRKVVLTVAFTESGSEIIIGTESESNSIGYGGYAAIIDIVSGKEIWRNFAPASLVASNEKQVVVADGKANSSTVSVFTIGKVEDVHDVQKLEGKSDIVNSISVSPDLHFILTGSAWRASRWTQNASWHFDVNASQTSALWDLIKGQTTQWWTDRIKDLSRNRSANSRNQKFSYNLASYKLPTSNNSFSRLGPVINSDFRFYEVVEFSPNGSLLAIGGGHIFEIRDSKSGKLFNHGKKGFGAQE